MLVLKRWLMEAGSILLVLALLAFVTWAIFPVPWERQYLFVFLGLMVLVGVWLYRGFKAIEKDLARKNPPPKHPE
jgi:hypothetical protein